MKYNHSKSYVALIAGAMLGSCGHNNHSDNNFIPDKVNLTGSVQKGPFIQGSDVQIYPLDATGNNLGTVYSTLTNDNLGNFSTTMAGLSQNYTGNLSLSGNGFFFKEVAGKLSDAQQTLKALYKADGKAAEIHLNLVTHLSYQRAMALLKGNSDLNASVAQAQKELTTSLKLAGLIYPADATGFGTSMDLFGSNNGANQYLLAVSCAFENAAGSSDSALQDLLNAYQLDLANDGAVNSKLTEKVKAGVVITVPTICITNLQKRAKELGVMFNVDVAGMNRALDTDLDGIVNFEDMDIDGDGINNNVDPESYNSKVVGSSYCDGTLCWEINPSPNTMTLAQATEYCNNLTLNGKNNWRTPTIDELRTLVKGCPNPETGGDCEVTDGCSSNCNSKCQPCGLFEGPGKKGCYWDSSLNGTCEGYLSSSQYTTTIDNGKGGQSFVNNWWIDFTKAWISSTGVEGKGFVRCVRDNN